MRENFGNGWVDRGPRSAVKGWDDDMRSIKATQKIDSREIGYSDEPFERVPFTLPQEQDEALYGNAAPHVPHWEEAV